MGASFLHMTCVKLPGKNPGKETATAANAAAAARETLKQAFQLLKHFLKGIHQIKEKNQPRKDTN